MHSATILMLVSLVWLFPLQETGPGGGLLPDSRSVAQELGLESAGRPSASASASLRVGYDGGFIIATDTFEGGRRDPLPHQLKFNGWGQFRMTNFVSDEAGLELNQLQLKRARLIFSGHSFTPDFSWMISLDGRSQADGAVRLLDYYLDYDLGHHFLGWEKRAWAIKLGQYKVPYSLARHVSAQEFQFTDRSVASMFFDANRSLAMGFASEVRRDETRWAWESAVFNGLVTGGAETGAAGSLDNNFAFSTRLAGYFGGDWGEDDLCDYDWHPTPVWRVGSAMAVSRIDRVGATEFGSLRVVDSGQSLASLLSPAISEYLVNMYSLDASVKVRGLSVSHEYYFRRIGDFVGAPQSSLFDHGFNLQSGYFVIPQRLEAIGRWSRVTGTSGTLGGESRSSDERSAGLVWYFRRHSAKLTFDATYLDGAPIDSFSLDVRRGMQGWLARTQLQFSF